MHKEPKSTQVMLLRARVLLLTAKLTDALTQTMAVLKLDPDDANAKEIRTRLKGIIRSQSEGGVHFRHGRWIDAIRDWDEALHVSQHPLECNRVSAEVATTLSAMLT